MYHTQLSPKMKGLFNHACFLQKQFFTQHNFNNDTMLGIQKGYDKVTVHFPTCLTQISRFYLDAISKYMLKNKVSWRLGATTFTNGSTQYKIELYF